MKNPNDKFMKNAMQQAKSSMQQPKSDFAFNDIDVEDKEYVSPVNSGVLEDEEGENTGGILGDISPSATFEKPSTKVVTTGVHLHFPADEPEFDEDGEPDFEEMEQPELEDDFEDEDIEPAPSSKPKSMVDSTETHEKNKQTVSESSPTSKYADIEEKEGPVIKGLDKTSPEKEDSGPSPSDPKTVQSGEKNEEDPTIEVIPPGAEQEYDYDSIRDEKKSVFSPKLLQNIGVFSTVLILILIIPLISKIFKGADNPKNNLFQSDVSINTPTQEETKDAKAWYEDSLILGEKPATEAANDSTLTGVSSPLDFVKREDKTDSKEKETDRFANADELTVYIQSSASAIYTKEQTLMSDYVNGKVGKDDCLNTMNTYGTAMDELSHLLLVNQDLYSAEAMQKTYTTLENMVQKALGYSDTSISLVSNDTPFMEIASELQIE